jgi:membrane-associated phospholipid phosphatase
MDTAVSTPTTGAAGRHPRAQPVAFAALLAVSLALTAAASGTGTLPGDVAIARWIQSAPAPLGAWLGWLGYWIGSAPVVIVLAAILAVLLWVRGEPRLAAVACGILVLRASNPVLKALVVSPRPIDGDVVVRELAGGFGYPSGHVMGATLLYGGIIWLAGRTMRQGLPRRLVRTIAAGLILVTALGRVATGAHWPSDVVGGLLWGTTGLLLLALAVEHPSGPIRAIGEDGTQPDAGNGQGLRHTL